LIREREDCREIGYGRGTLNHCGKVKNGHIYFKRERDTKSIIEKV
jgi:hypothetical protein